MGLLDICQVLYQGLVSTTWLWVLIVILVSLAVFKEEQVQVQDIFLIGRTDDYGSTDIVTTLYSSAPVCQVGRLKEDVPDSILLQLQRRSRHSLAEIRKGLFCTTEYTKQARRILDTHGIVVITGKPGSGKTWCARHLASKTLDRIPIIISHPDDWGKIPLRKKMEKGFIVLIDDIFGAQKFFEDRNDKWQRLYDHILDHVKKHNIHVIIASKSHIYHQYPSATSGISLFRSENFVSLDELPIPICEKKEMLSKYNETRTREKALSLRECQTAAESVPDIGFPYCCQIFREDDNLGVEFFKNPLRAVFRSLEELYDNDTKLYYLLVYIMLENGQMDPNNMEMISFKKRTKKYFGDPVLLFRELKDLCNTLVGTFLRSEKNSTKFHFMNTFHLKSVFLHYVKKQTKLAINHAPLSLVLELIRTNRESPENQEVHVLKSPEHGILLERLINEVRDDTLDDILDHSCFSDSRCLERLVRLIRRLKDGWHLKECKKTYSLCSSPEMFDKIKAMGKRREYADITSLPFEMGYQTEITLFCYDHILCWLIMKNLKEVALNFLEECDEQELKKLLPSALPCAIYMGHVDIYNKMKDCEFDLSDKCLTAFCASKYEILELKNDILSEKILQIAAPQVLENCLLISVHMNHVNRVKVFVGEIFRRNNFGRKVRSDILDRAYLYKLMQITVISRTETVTMDAKKTTDHRKTLQHLTRFGAKYNQAICLYLASCQNDVGILEQFVENSSLIRDRNGVSPLHLACQNGFWNNAELLLKSGSTNRLTNNDDTPLHYAVNSNNPEVFDKLLEREIDVTMKNKQGRTAFHEACFVGNEHAGEELLKKIPDVNVQDNAGKTGLHYVAESNAPKLKLKGLTDLMIRENADINRKDSLGQSPLFKSVARGDVILSKRFLQDGADPNATDNLQRTPLHVCAETDMVSEDLAQVLLENGADPGLVSKNGLTPLEIILSNMGTLDENELDSRRKTADIIMRAGGSEGDGRLSLHRAIAKEDKSLLRHLLQMGACCNNKDEKGQSPLHLAMEQKYFEAVPLLMENRANPYLQDNDGKTVIYLCEVESSFDDISVLKQLMPVKQGINISNNYGWTPLHMATLFGEPTVVKWMLNEGADPNIQNEDGDTPLHILMRKIDIIVTEPDTPSTEPYRKIELKTGKYGQILLLLLKSSISALDMQNNSGKTPRCFLTDARLLDEVNAVICGGLCENRLLV